MKTHQLLTDWANVRYYKTMCGNSFTKEVLYLKWNEHYLLAFLRTLMIVKLMVSITSDVSLWYRPSYKNALNHDN